MQEQLICNNGESSLIQAFLDNRVTLIKIATRITGCRSRAEDVVQDAFFRLRRSPSAASIRGQLSYIYQTVRNLAIDHYRKQASEKRYYSPEEDGVNVALHGASPEALHLNQVTLEQIAEHLTQLPERTQYAFEMYCLHGVPQKVIASELGVSPTLVNFMIRDAMQLCRQAGDCSTPA
jgi:RNA polymerase sigma factor (sigma-70 family)